MNQVPSVSSFVLSFHHSFFILLFFHCFSFFQRAILWRNRVTHLKGGAQVSRKVLKRIKVPSSFFYYYFSNFKTISPNSVVSVFKVWIFPVSCRLSSQEVGLFMCCLKTKPIPHSQCLQCLVETLWQLSFHKHLDFSWICLIQDQLLYTGWISGCRSSMLKASSVKSVLSLNKGGSRTHHHHHLHVSSVSIVQCSESRVSVFNRRTAVKLNQASDFFSLQNVSSSSFGASLKSEMEFKSDSQVLSLKLSSLNQQQRRLWPQWEVLDNSHSILECFRVSDSDYDTDRIIDATDRKSSPTWSN